MNAGEPTKFTYGAEWQRTLLHLVLEDERFADVVAPHVQKEYFEHDIFKWFWATVQHHSAKYGTRPSWAAMAEHARRLEPKIRDEYGAGLLAIQQVPGQDVPWVRDTAVEWVRRNVFSRAFEKTKQIYNAGDLQGAYDHLMREMDRFSDATTPADQNETWFFEDFTKRDQIRTEYRNHSTIIPTGIAPLDNLLNGGLDLGQFGLWMAYSKAGKTSHLLNLGRVATRGLAKNVAHFFFEGTKEQITNRYDASFSAELYAAVRRGEWGSGKYAQLFSEYQTLRGRLYIRGFTDAWNYSVEDVWEVLQTLRRRHGWVPDMLLIDYADLLKGRGRQDNDMDSNAAAYRDLKTLSTKGRGYAIWSAAQAKKPASPDYDTKPHLLKSSDLGGRYEKVKVADFVASLNATLEERTVQRIIRIWVEAVRDNPAGVEIMIPVQYDRMLFGAGAEHSGLNCSGILVDRSAAQQPQNPMQQLGYGQQKRAL